MGKDKEEEKEDGTGAAALKLVELSYNTPEDRMPELTYIGRRQSLNFSLMVMYEHSIEFMADVMRGKIKEEEGKPTKLILLTEVLRNYYYKHQRSVGGQHLKNAVELAQSQIEALSADESFKESEDW